MRRRVAYVRRPPVILLMRLAQMELAANVDGGLSSSRRSPPMPTPRTSKPLHTGERAGVIPHGAHKAAAPQRRVVALLVETSNEYARGLVHGVIRYLREHEPWSCYLTEHGRGDEPPDWLGHWSGDGILARIENERIAKAVIASGLPAVDLSAANLVPGIPWVETDDTAIAKAAFDHLYERGFRQFGYCGDAQYNWSNWRSTHFQKLAHDAGCACHVLQSSAAPQASAEWSVQTGRIAAWIAQLPRPVGVMACYDPLGRQVLEACRQVNTHVPDDVAVIGVDDDELLCELSDPPLSSIAPDTLRTGYEAAALLHRMMDGQPVEPRAHLIPPLGVAPRRSSDALAIDDEDISEAVRFIRENACQGITVADVLAATPLSRRVMESRFKKLIGRTPHDEIQRVQLERVKQYLRDTDLPLAEVAKRTGYEHVEYLSVVFKKKIGVPPSTYRREHSRR